MTSQGFPNRRSFPIRVSTQKRRGLECVPRWQGSRILPFYSSYNLCTVSKKLGVFQELRDPLIRHTADTEYMTKVTVGPKIKTDGASSYVFSAEFHGRRKFWNAPIDEPLRSESTHGLLRNVFWLICLCIQRRPHPLRI
mmetsp:Transcript_534/g.1013  ORF Transcript_534/g.1013 Transcript_534/m.1013 type:complete len:139 (+) Transcript_534:131-547(+)